MTRLRSLLRRLDGAGVEFVVVGGVAVIWDARTLRNGLNFTLETDEGMIDLLGEVTGLGNYDDIALRANEIEIDGSKVRVLALDDLIRSKAAAGRAKDLVDLEALRVIAGRPKA